MSTPEERASQRARTWRGGRAPIADAERMDAEFWRSMSPAERFVAVWELAWEAYGDEAAPGLRGSPSGVRPR